LPLVPLRDNVVDSRDAVLLPAKVAPVNIGATLPVLTANIVLAVYLPRLAAEWTGLWLGLAT